MLRLNIWRYSIPFRSNGVLGWDGGSNSVDNTTQALSGHCSIHTQSQWVSSLQRLPNRDAVRGQTIQETASSTLTFERNVWCDARHPTIAVSLHLVSLSVVLELVLVLLMLMLMLMLPMKVSYPRLSHTHCLSSLDEVLFMDISHGRSQAVATHTEGEGDNPYR